MFVMSNPLAAATTAIPKIAYPLSIMMAEELQPIEGQATFKTAPSEAQAKRGFSPLDAHNAEIKRKYGMAGAPKYLRNLAGVDFAASILTKTAVTRGLVFNEGMKKRSMFIANDGGVVLRLRSQIATAIRNRVLSVMPKEERLERGGMEMIYPPGFGRDPIYGTANKAPDYYYNPVYGQSSTYEEMLEATTTGFMATGGNYHFMGRLVEGMPKDPRRGLVNHGVAVTREEALKAHVHCGFLHSPHALAMGANNRFTVWEHLQPAWRNLDDACTPLKLNAEVGADGVLDPSKAIKINLKADLGLPYCAKGTDPEALAAAFAVAKEMDADYEFRTDAGAFYRRDFNRAPWRVTVMGKTKTDIYKLKKIEGAALRFVNVVPGHLKMLMARSTQKYDEEKTSLIKQSAFWQDHIGVATGPESIESLREGNACMGIARARYNTLRTDPLLSDESRRGLNPYKRYFGDWDGLSAGAQDLERAYLATNGLLRSSQKIGMTQETPGLIINSLDVQIREGRSAWTHCGDDTIFLFRTAGFHTVNTSPPGEPSVLSERPTFRLYGITTDFKSFDLTQNLTLLAENVNVTAEAMSRIDGNDAKLWKAVINERKVLLVDGGVVDMRNGGASGVNLQSSLNDMHTDVFCQRFDKALLKKCKVGRLGKDPHTGAIIQLPGSVKVPPPIQDDATNEDVNYRVTTLDAFYHPDPLTKEDVERLIQDVARSLGFEVTLGSFACCDNPEITSDTYHPKTAKFFDGQYKWNHQVTTWLSLEKLTIPFLGMEITAARPMSIYRPFYTPLGGIYTTHGFPPATLNDAGRDISPHLRVIEQARKVYTSIYLDKRAREGGGIFTMAPQVNKACKTRSIYRDELDGGEVRDRTYVDGDGDTIHFFTMLSEGEIRPPSDSTVPCMTTNGMNTIGIAQVQLSRAVKNLLFSGKMWIKDRDEHAMHDCVRLLSMVGNWGCLSISDPSAMFQWEKMVSETQSYWPIHAKVPRARFEAEEESEASLFHPFPNPTNSYGEWPQGAFPYDALTYCHISQDVDLEIARFDSINWLMLKMAEKCNKKKNGMRDFANNAGEMYDFFASDPDSDEKSPMAMAALAYFHTEVDENLGDIESALGDICTFDEAKRRLPRPVLLALYGPTGLDKTRPASGARSNWGEMPAFPLVDTSPQGVVAWRDVHPAMKATPPYVTKVFEESIKASFKTTDALFIIGKMRMKETRETGLHWFNKSIYTRCRKAVFKFYEVVDKIWGHPHVASISTRLAVQAQAKRAKMMMAKWVIERYPNGLPFENMYPQGARDADEQNCVDGGHGMNFIIQMPAQGGLPARKINGRAACVRGRPGSLSVGAMEGKWNAHQYYHYLCFYFTHPLVIAAGDLPLVDTDVRDYVRDPESNMITSAYGPYGGDHYTDDPTWGVRSARSMKERVLISEISFEDFWSMGQKGFQARDRVGRYIAQFSPMNSLTLAPGFTITQADLTKMDEASSIASALQTSIAYYEARDSPFSDSRFCGDMQQRVDALTCVAAVPDESSLDPLSALNNKVSWADEDEDEAGAPTFTRNRVLTAEHLWTMSKILAQDEDLECDPHDDPQYVDKINTDTGEVTREFSHYAGKWTLKERKPQRVGPPSLAALAAGAIAERIFETGMADGGLAPVHMPDLDTDDPTISLMKRMLECPEAEGGGGWNLLDLRKMDLSVRKRPRGPLIVTDPGAGAPPMPRSIRLDPAAPMVNLRPPTEKSFGRPPPNVEVRDATAVAITEGGAAKTRAPDLGLEKTSGLTKTQKRKASRKRSAAAKAGYSEKSNFQEQDFSAQDEEQAEKDAMEIDRAGAKIREKVFRMEGGH